MPFIYTFSSTWIALPTFLYQRSSGLFFKLEDIKKRWQEYTEEVYKKDLHDPDNHDGVITDLEPDILECEEIGRAHV